MSLLLTGGLRLGDLDLDVELELPGGEMVALLGPNGAGKTTLLRVIAGLQSLDHGRLVLDGDILDDPGAGTFVAPERRSVGYLFQDHQLFPHLSVTANVAFGPAARRLPDARARAAKWVGRVGLEPQAQARAAQLSGGQSQRAALARALAFDPQVVLLDEPLAAVDASTRAEVRHELKRHLDGHQGVKLMVTHNPVEAAALGDRIVVLESGRIIDQGVLADIAQRPRSRYIAEMAGVNVWRGRAEGSLVDLGTATLAAPQTHLGAVFAVVHPAAVSLYRKPPSGSPRNVWRGDITGIELTAHRARVRIEAGVPLVAEVTPAAVADLGLEVGQVTWASFKATEVQVYPA
ncbi:MAG TPA: ABC transporter ATP-binding protein [Candidatus Dormibacteraeota bacterium]|jgi:molybdate transport system ATP-binding protein|nr:ABC transporter ATP-binding protein [Candidatus Dormibacteraeota bacterium]